jgi:hypothetical protein
MRLIDADALKEKIDNIWNGRSLSFLGAKILAMIDHEPTIDAVEVVRCKDCRYRKKVGTLYYCELDEFNVQDEDFCSWGERREE